MIATIRSARSRATPPRRTPTRTPPIHPAANGAARHDELKAKAGLAEAERLADDRPDHRRVDEGARGEINDQVSLDRLEGRYERRPRRIVVIARHLEHGDRASRGAETVPHPDGWCLAVLGWPDHAFGALIPLAQTRVGWPRF